MKTKFLLAAILLLSAIGATAQTPEFKTLLTKAQAGDVEAQKKTAYAYKTGEGVEKDAEKAFYWYSKAALRDDAEAMGMLGVAYLDGTGVEADFDKGIEWRTRAAEKGYVWGQSDLGMDYFFGIKYKAGKFQQDYDKAFFWFLKAAEQPAVPEKWTNAQGQAMYFLGNCYLDGYGVEPDARTAFEWYGKAAELADANAQSMMGD